MPERKKIPCPQCGTPMNFHAEKVDYGALLASTPPDPRWGGVLAQFHTCPNPKCRFILERPAV
ncbi:MAG: hypothetical protein ACM3SU_01685 [Acidobacteriota bacterium]